MMARRLAQQPPEAGVVPIREEDRRPAPAFARTAALDHMQRPIRKQIPPEPRHVRPDLEATGTTLLQDVDHVHSDPLLTAVGVFVAHDASP